MASFTDNTYISYHTCAILKTGSEEIYIISGPVRLADDKYGEKTHAALMAVVAETETSEDEDVNEKPVTKSVVLHAADGKVNIRFGNGDEYGLMTTIADGTEVPYVATADNAWMAVAVNGMVGWVKI